MRMLQIHSDGFSYTAKRKAIKTAEDVKEKTYSTNESCLVNFIAAETSDQKDVKKAAKLTAEMIAKAAEEVKEQCIIVYPWVHLTEKPSPPSAALKLLKGIEKELVEKGLEVVRVPFGWYKEFEMKVKGHPLSELSRDFVVEGNEEVEADLSDGERARLLKSMTKNKTQAPRGKNDLKSTRFEHQR